MEIRKTVLAAALAAISPLAFIAPANAQMMPLNDPVVGHPDPESLFTSRDPVLHRNKQAALHIMRELLQCNQWHRAGEWLTDRYIQHNPLAASGLEGVVNYFVNVARVQPTPTCDRLVTPIVSVQAEGDYVTVVIRRELPIPGDPNGGTYTTTWFDSWRFVDGKADQHWDPATLPNYTPPAVAADNLLREAQDRAAIERLMWNYVRAIDTWNADAYAAVFTEDGSFGNTRGREALRAMVSGMVANRAADAPMLHHVMSNQTIEFINPNRAVVRYYWQTVTRGVPAGPRPEMLAQGWGEDVVIKQNGRWLIQSRNVAPG
ncbi:SgcJ/EcaC family oxidoreductase [Alteraurantiacibacter palmitatis]|uniref:SgcJ/EcaC family oxidoreductase n=1 Tax=Alteraurantiacibacter palmitatis TaxID=2054628 RepID=A0ABV7E539_9SPHN